MTSHYVLCPGWVRSRTDGDAHFIGARQLAHLYGVPFRDCYVMPSDWLSPSEIQRRHLLRARVASGELIALRPRADGKYTLPEAPVPAVPPTTPKPRTPSNGCHNRAPFKASTELRDHHGRLVTSWPFRMASDCQYTLSDLGQADKACHGCCWRREPMVECTETQPSS